MTVMETIVKGTATVSDLENLYKMGYEFTIEDGAITKVEKAR